jgi:ferredoxin-NADP reductase
MTSNDQTNILNLHVVEILELAPGIRSLTLAREDGQALPGWDAGSHLDLHLPDGDVRSYSLVNSDPDLLATANPYRYRLGVRLEQSSKGGSAYVHGLQQGQSVTASLPKNHFPLEACAGETVLVAGGIGITPIISMAAELVARRRPLRVVYAGRNRSNLALLDELERLCAAQLTAHCDDASGIYSISALMASMQSSASLYVCGPVPMIDAAIDTARALDWKAGRLHFELFTPPAPIKGDAGFDVVLAQSNRRIRVAAHQTILEALIDAGETPLSDCRRGDCGLCQVAVLEGVPDHRDYYLSDHERQSNSVMQICVSRSTTPVLVLDI